MMKYIIAITISLLIVVMSANANDRKGMRVYKKLCVGCHGGPYKGSGMHTIDEWEDIFDSSKTPFIELHKDIPDALKKFESSLSKKRRKYLFKFLINNAKDSGVVPGCFCYCG